MHVLCVAAYNLLGVPEGADKEAVGERVFNATDVGSVFWVGVNDVYVRGGRRHVQAPPLWWLPPGTIGVVTGVHEGARNVASVVELNACRGKTSVVLNPEVAA